MARSCCAKPIARIIKVGNSESGIVGLEEIFKSVYASKFSNEEDVKLKLLMLAKGFGNYITQNMEEIYKDALFLEYRQFCKKQMPKQT